MALPEVCAVWIEQRVQEELEAGNTSLRGIGREIAAEVEKHFEVKGESGNNFNKSSEDGEEKCFK